MELSASIRTLPGELSSNTDWQNENRAMRVIYNACVCIHVYLADRFSLSSAFLNLDLLATNGATLGACIASI